jgi:Predicted transcriptional regulators
MHKIGATKSLKFQEQLKFQRELRGWSQAKIAEEIGCTPNRISSWERGIALPSTYFREKLCLLFQMNAQELGLLLIAEEPDADLPVNEVSSAVTLNATDEPLPLPQRKSNTVFPPLFFQPSSKRKFFIVAIVALIILTIISIFFSFWEDMFDSSPSNPYAPYIGHLVLDDPLQDQSKGMNWQEGVNDKQARCLFKQQAYVVVEAQPGLFRACMAQNTDYKNFAYEVEMVIQSGEFGGLVFRSENSIDAHYYIFRIHTDGSYWLFRFADHSIEHATLLDNGMLHNFTKGLGKTNLIAVVAQNDLLTLYVNRQEVSSIRDGGYTHGQIGVLAGTMTMPSGEASFKNAKVWIW